MIKRMGGNIRRHCILLFILSALNIEVTSFPLVELTTTAYLQLRTTKTKDLMKYAEGVLLLTMKLQSLIEKSLNKGARTKASTIDFVDIQRLQLSDKDMDAVHNEGLFVQTHYQVVSELIQYMEFILTSGEVQHLPTRPATQTDSLKDIILKLINNLETLLLDIKIYAQKTLSKAVIAPSEQFTSLGDTLFNEKIRLYAMTSDIKAAMDSLFKFYSEHSKVLSDLLART